MSIRETLDKQKRQHEEGVMRCYYRHREERLAAAKARRERLIAEGICPKCGKNPLADGLHYCEACKEKTRVYNKRKRMERAMEQWK